MTDCDFRRRPGGSWKCRRCEYETPKAHRRAPRRNCRIKPREPAAKPIRPKPCNYLGPVVKTVGKDVLDCGCSGASLRQCALFGELVTVQPLREDSRKLLAKLEAGYNGRTCYGCSRTRPRATAAAVPASLAAVTSFFNPAHFGNRLDNYHTFAAELRRQGVPLVTVEVSVDGRFELPLDEHTLRLSSTSRLWHKEAALNTGIRSIWHDVDAIAWLDCDVIFGRDDWPTATLEALGRCDVCQPFDEVRWLDHDRLGWRKSQKSFAVWRKGHPGFAWAATSEFLRRAGGLFDAAIFGGGDILMAECFSGSRTLAKTPRTLRPAAAAWSAAAACNGIGVVDGVIEHLPHGSRRNRRYQWRGRRLDALHFDPARHLARQPSGLYRWADQAPAELVATVHDYFDARNEDE